MKPNQAKKRAQGGIEYTIIIGGTLAVVLATIVLLNANFGTTNANVQIQVRQVNASIGEVAATPTGIVVANPFEIVPTPTPHGGPGPLFGEKPDLTVEDIIRDASGYKVTFCNYGTDTSSDKFRVKLVNLATGREHTTPPSPSDKFSVPPLEQCDETYPIACSLVGSTCTGAETVRAVLDSFDTVDELDESNNQFEKTFTTATPTPTPTLAPTTTPTATPSPAATGTPSPAATATPTPTPSPTPIPCAAFESFDAMPKWSSELDASWGYGTAEWGIGPANNYLKAERKPGGYGSSVRVEVYDVVPFTAYTMKVKMRGQASGPWYWTEAAYRLGDNGAGDFDSNSDRWALVNKFSDDWANGNGNNWDEYSATVYTGSFDKISVGFKQGNGRGGGGYQYGWTGPAGNWDDLSICPQAPAEEANPAILHSFDSNAAQAELRIDGSHICTSPQCTNVDEQVTPGVRLINVTKYGFYPYAEAKQFSSGSTYDLYYNIFQHAAPKAKLIVIPEPSGSDVRLYVDGVDKGYINPFRLIELSGRATPYDVKVTKGGYQDYRYSLTATNGITYALYPRLVQKAEKVVRANDADCLLDYPHSSVPATMTAGQAYSVTVKVKNTGTNTWTSGKDYRLATTPQKDVNTLAPYNFGPYNAIRWNLPGPEADSVTGYRRQPPSEFPPETDARVFLSGTESITPGQYKQFAFSVVAPGTPSEDAYDLSAMMVQDGSYGEFFGEICLFKVFVVSPTPPPASPYA